ncbi:hypothetical protein F0L68_33440 [Solihabitans fulvus]|uniref:PKD domain-containing protein n=1 Tax=Solihabitans fulvus TaxID=1892852 RepID=A0A5B2WPE0_9PSEU|nr:hypothetical protein F0L68_33440 [Solihabitans fulvus]
MLRRASVVAGAAVVLALAGAAPAFANGWGNVTCGQSPTPDCQLGAGSGGNGGNQDGGHEGGDQQPSHDGSGNNGSGTGGNSGGDTIIGGSSNLASCSYVPSEYQPPAGATTAAYHRPSPSGGTTVQLVAFTRPVANVDLSAQPAAGPAPGQQGSWYLWKCATAGITDGLYHPPVWIANGQPAPGAPPLQSPAQLAQIARNQLRFPTPSIAANPAGEQLVNLPTWMWLSSGWGPVSATATVPGVSVTATATPTSVTWSMGDGSTVTCTGAGTPFHPGTAPTASSPDCGHTYRTSSASQAGQVFPVTATVHWTVTWAGAGQGGVFPDLTTNGNAAFRVAESQALNNGG